jgi:hypothetical protein
LTASYDGIPSDPAKENLIGVDGRSVPKFTALRGQLGDVVLIEIPFLNRRLIDRGISMPELTRLALLTIIGIATGGG